MFSVGTEAAGQKKKKKKNEKTKEKNCIHTHHRSKCLILKKKKKKKGIPLFLKRSASGKSILNYHLLMRFPCSANFIYK